MIWFLRPHYVGVTDVDSGSKSMPRVSAAVTPGRLLNLLTELLEWRRTSVYLMVSGFRKDLEGYLSALQS